MCVMVCPFGIINPSRFSEGRHQVRSLPEYGLSDLCGGVPDPGLQIGGEERLHRKLLGKTWVGRSP
jgi:hypothetical protein